MLPIAKTLTLVVPIVSYVAYHAVSKAPYHSLSCALLNVGCPRDIPIQGFVAQEYEKAYDIFLSNFEKGHDVGASISAYVNGEQVLSLNGGWQDVDKKLEYNNNTLQMVYSSTKALAAIVVSQLVEAGLLSYDEKIATYWPEFAQGNKENVTLTDLMRHMSGVGALDYPLSLENASDPDVFSDILARQPHNYNGERVHSYHAITQGWYINEVVRRVDPQHRTIDGFAREFQEKWGLEWYLKPDVVEGLDLTRISQFYEPPLYQTIASFFATLIHPTKDKTFVTGLFDKKSLFYRSIINPKLDQGMGVIMNKDPRHRAIEAPAYSGHSNADSIAKLAAMMANRGKAIVPGEPNIYENDEIYEESTRFVGDEPDLLIKWGKLINLRGGLMKFNNDDAFHFDDDMNFIGGVGSGGSVFVFNEEYKIGFAYVMNGHIGGSGPDYRSIPILKAVFEQAKKEKNGGHSTDTKRVFKLFNKKP